MISFRRLILSSNQSRYQFLNNGIYVFLMSLLKAVFKKFILHHKIFSDQRQKNGQTDR